MNTYRVDRMQEACSPPCGMNSLLYAGNNLDAALHVFHFSQPGKNAWNSDDPSYGIGLSIYNFDRRDYVIKRWKGK